MSLIDDFVDRVAADDSMEATFDTNFVQEVENLVTHSQFREKESDAEGKYRNCVSLTLFGEFKNQAIVFDARCAN